MKITIDTNTHIELIEEKHASEIFGMVNDNRAYLREWLTFVDRMQSVDFATNFTKGCMQRHADGEEFAFVIYHKDIMVGRIGIYKIDPQNKIAEIGYWVIQNHQGLGLISNSCKKIIDFCFEELQINRIEIKCATSNIKSKSIPEKFNFTNEGIIRQGEFLNGKFVDLFLFSLLKSDLG